MAFRAYYLALILLFGVGQVAQAEEFDAPSTLNIGETGLLLNGSGVRSRMFIDLYVGSLYLSKDESDAQKIIDSDEPMAIQLSIVSSLITGEKLRDATMDGFRNAVGDTSRLADRIARFLGAFDEPVDVGDQFLLSWHPDSETLNVKRNAALVEQIKGKDFKQALFAIWLGDNPVQESLKDQMLGVAD